MKTMKKSIKNLYKEAVNNELFKTEFKKADIEYEEPKFYSSDKLKIIFACIYMGWLIGRGEFNQYKY